MTPRRCSTSPRLLGADGPRGGERDHDHRQLPATSPVTGHAFARQSGTTARFVAPVLALAPGPWELDGDAQLAARPMEDLYRSLEIDRRPRSRGPTTGDRWPVRTISGPVASDSVHDLGGDDEPVPLRAAARLRRSWTRACWNLGRRRVEVQAVRRPHRRVDAPLRSRCRRGGIPVPRGSRWIPGEDAPGRARRLHRVVLLRRRGDDRWVGPRRRARPLERAGGHRLPRLPRGRWARCCSRTRATPRVSSSGDPDWPGSPSMPRTRPMSSRRLRKSWRHWRRPEPRSRVSGSSERRSPIGSAVSSVSSGGAASTHARSPTASSSSRRVHTYRRSDPDRE